MHEDPKDRYPVEDYKPYLGFWTNEKLLANQKRQKSVFFEKIESAYSIATTLILVSQLVLTFWIFNFDRFAHKVGYDKVLPYRIFILLALVAIATAPVIWWWKMSQAFQDWVTAFENDPDACTAQQVSVKYERERFDINGRHALALFAAISTLTLGLIVKFSLEPNPTFDATPAPRSTTN